MSIIVLYSTESQNTSTVLSAFNNSHLIPLSVVSYTAKMKVVHISHDLTSSKLYYQL